MRHLAVFVGVMGTLIAVDRETLRTAVEDGRSWLATQGVTSLSSPAPAEVVPVVEPVPAPEQLGAVDDSRVALANVPDAAGIPPEEPDPPAVVEDANDVGVVAAAVIDAGDGIADDGMGDDAPVEAEPLPVEHAEGDPVLVSIARETWIFSEPRWRSRKLGYLRAGATVKRDEDPVHRRGCRRGWYRIEPEGFVCHNRTATLDREHPVAQLSATRPFMGDLPYTYVRSRYPTPPLYVRLPTEEQQRKVEPSLDGHRRKHRALAAKASYTPFPEPDPIPGLLGTGEVIPGLGGQNRGAQRVTLGHARVRSGFALLGTYEHEGRRFGLTTELALLPLDRTRVVPPSALSGVRLSEEFGLPLAIVRSKYAKRYAVHPENGGFMVEEPLPWRSAVALTGRTKKRGETWYLEARDGSYLRADQVIHLRKFNKAPKWARQGKKWIDVSLLRQALVAYEGTTPVYATIVSTGAGGIGDPEETHATVQGAFLVHTKHLSVTMDGDEAGDEFDLRDVPYVQYFTEGYALHGAYWHDDFGRPRSHGCVNLAPKDAAWLFRWTDPPVPKGWHAALSLKKGTIVYVHP